MARYGRLKINIKELNKARISIEISEIKMKLGVIEKRLSQIQEFDAADVDEIYKAVENVASRRVESVKSPWLSCCLR